MEKKKEINYEDFMTNSWNRLKQILFARYENIKTTESIIDEEEVDARDAEEVEDQDDNEDESELVEDTVKYTESEEVDDSQYDDVTKLLIEGIK